MKKALLSLLCILTLSLAASADYTITFKSGDSTTQDSSTELTDANAITKLGITGSVASVTTSKCYLGKSDFGIKLASGSYAGKIDMTLKTANQITTKKLSVKCACNKDNHVLTISLNAGKANEATYTITTNTTLETYDLDLKEPVALSNIKLSAVKGDVVYVKSITVYEYVSNLSPADLSFAEDSYTVNLGESFDAPKVANPNNLIIKYSSENESVATVDASTGEVSIKGAGSTKIWANSDATDTYEAGKASYTLTVKDPNAEVYTETIDFTSKGYTNATSVSTVNGTEIKLVFSKGSNSNDPKYYTDGTAIRFYGNNTLTITAPDKYYVKSFALVTASSNAAILANSSVIANNKSVGSLNTDTKKWESGSDYENEIVWTNGNVSSGQTRIQKITIEYAKIPGLSEPTPAEKTVIDLEEENFVVTLNGEPIEFDDEMAEFEADADSLIEWSYQTDVENADLLYAFTDMDEEGTEPIEINNYKFKGEKDVNFVVSVTSGENSLTRYLTIFKKYPTECPVPTFNVKDGAEVYVGDVITAKDNGAEIMVVSVNGVSIDGDSWTVAGEIGEEIELTAQSTVTGKDGDIDAEATITVTIIDRPGAFFNYNEKDAFGILTSTDKYDGGDKTLATIKDVTVSVTGTYRIYETTKDGETSYTLRLHATQNNNGIGKMTVSVPANYTITGIEFGTGSQNTASSSTDNKTPTIYSSGECANNKWVPKEGEEPVSSLTISRGTSNPSMVNMTVFYELRPVVLDHESGKFSNNNGAEGAKFIVGEEEYDFVGEIDINTHDAFEAGKVHQVTVTSNGKTHTFHVLTAPKFEYETVDNHIVIKANYDKDGGVKLTYRKKDSPTAGKKTRADEGIYDETTELSLTAGEEPYVFFASHDAVEGVHEALTSALVTTKTYDAVTGIAEVVGEDWAEAVVYDLNGRVVRGELTPGVYVLVKDGRALKVVVR